ncbi:hypothetical protein FE257_007418 [Aspergillus nanangensis]|uniref:Beta-mannosidase A n=1 Tax=Aspergillus nanangensis TaxID=2582783 RepID=A0AAD4CMM2_ASPNN|nr:hypothetical protein FE257_007418 [Aspergillus nanangensis]
MKCKHFVLLPLAALAAAESPATSPMGAEQPNLGGQWNARNTNGSISIPATVPGLIQTDLYAAGILPDPLAENNFELYDWVPQENWTFSRQIPKHSPLGRAWSSFKRVYLVFDGVDTAANIRFNDESIGFVNNQFRQWTFDVTSSLQLSGKKRKTSTLEVEILSPIEYALGVFVSTGSPYTVFTNYAEVYPEGREYIRKVQSDFGWDWGPHFAPQGIYRDAYLVGLDDGAFVTNSFVDIYKPGQRPNTIPTQSDPWIVNVSIDYLTASVSDHSILAVDIDGHGSQRHNPVLGVGKNSATVEFEIPDSQVERWWPAAFGKPVLYDAIISLYTTDSRKIKSKTAYKKRVGFRTIVLDLSPYADREGNHFSFQINGNVMNAKGSNMVPLSPFEPTVTRQNYRQIIEAAIASNFNMLRVWSSGNYYTDDFYEAADELGILLWSEFQFSDNYYPVVPSFIDNVAEEVKYQMRRLNRYPSMALWCGGNELAKYTQLAKNNATYGDSWIRNQTILLDQTPWPLVYSNTRSLSWLASSNSQGYLSYNPATGNWVNRNGTVNAYHGAIEDYNLGLDQVFNHADIPAGRFAVEFGAMSYDSLESYQTIFKDDEIRQDGEVLLNRCYDGGSYESLYAGIKRYYIMPNKTQPLHQFRQFSWTSQIYQAEIMKHQIESYRRSISLPENNLGQLFWQLNAPWTTLTLNSIEYTGRWKVLQYVAKQTFRPVVVSSWFEPSNQTLRVWAASDAWEPVSGSITAKWMTWTGDVLSTDTHNFSLSALDSAQVSEHVGWNTILPPKSLAKDLVLLLELAAHSSQPGTEYSSENFWIPGYASNATLVDPGLKITYLGDLSWSVTATKGVGAYVWLTVPKGVMGFFDDNAVFLAKGEARVFKFTMQQEDHGDGKWIQEVTVSSLWDNLLP